MARSAAIPASATRGSSSLGIRTGLTGVARDEGGLAGGAIALAVLALAVLAMGRARGAAIPYGPAIAVGGTVTYLMTTS